MLNQAGNGFALPPDHAEQAFKVLLKGRKVPAWALAAYYLRNYGFNFDGNAGHDDLIAMFKAGFLFDQGTDFGTLFEDEEPLFFTEDWFEPYDGLRTEVSRSA